MRVLITGGAGFIGSHLADRLLARKDEVLVIDNYATGRHDNLETQDGLTVVEGSISDAELVNQQFEAFRPEVVVHAAASYKDPENWIEDAKTNVEGTAVITQACQQVKVNRLIYFQTALCYGLKPLEQPITLDHPILSDGSSYAISKSAGEQFLRLSGLDYVSFRLANAYGPRNMSGPLPTFYHRLTNDKPCFVMKTRRDFIYIADLVDCVTKAIDGQGDAGAYHISSGTDYSIKELFDSTVSALEIKLDSPVDEREKGVDDAFTILLDPSKTKQTFDWQTTTPLQEGINAAIKYYQEFGISETYTHLKVA